MGLAGACLAPDALLAASRERQLSFVHTHTGEALTLTYADPGGYLASALERVNVLLRDFRTDEIHSIDPALLDLLHAVAAATRTAEPFHVISGYRSPRTNAVLRMRSEGVAKASLHMQGRAIDIRLPDVPLRRLRETAVGLRLGGVGYYAASDFVHVDTGRVRLW
jgi:uncharacterized protein YcbK (DUF882 family)